MSETLLPAAVSDASLQWAQRLVRISSISEQSNRPLIETIADHLRTLGVPLRLTHDEAGAKANLFATLGAGKPGGVILSGHTDTVPWTGQAWTVDPLGAELREGRALNRCGRLESPVDLRLFLAQTR